MTLSAMYDSSVGKRTKYYSSERPITYTNSALAVPLVEEAVGMSADPINGKENMELEKIGNWGVLTAFIIN